MHPQSEGFTTYAEWDFTEKTKYPLLLHEPYALLYSAQVIKQTDLVLAMYWQSHKFTDEQKARNVDYYERRTVRDSSLSACAQAVMCANVGHLELAHDYTYEAALVDLREFVLPLCDAESAYEHSHVATLSAMIEVVTCPHRALAPASVERTSQRPFAGGVAGGCQ